MNPAKRKTIVKVVQGKINDYLSHLPKELAQQIKNEIVVSGGCFTSLLRGEPINDFDVYFRTIAAAEAVAKHYAELSDGYVQVQRITSTNIKGEEEEIVINYIASSGVSGENPDERDEATEWLEGAEVEAEPEVEKPEKYRLQFISRNAITLSNGIQLITRFQGDARQIHKNFDFVHATCSYDAKTSTLDLPQAALESILSRELRYQGSLYPIATIFRVRKFINRGWRITAGELLKIMWQISEVNLKDRYTLVDQLTGVDASHMNALVNALEGADPSVVDSTYVATIIDRIFNGVAE